MTRPWRVLKDAIAFFAARGAGFWPVMSARNFCNSSRSFSSRIFPTPQFTTTFHTRGIAMIFLYPNFVRIAGTTLFLYFSSNVIMVIYRLCISCTRGPFFRPPNEYQYESHRRMPRRRSSRETLQTARVFLSAPLSGPGGADSHASFLYSRRQP